MAEQKLLLLSIDPPNTDLSHFVTECSKLFDRLLSKKNTAFIVGDFNVNLLNYETHTETAEFLNTALEYYLYPTITKPTRFCKTTSTLIDNIFVSNLNEDYNAGLFINDLSDHLPIFYISSTKVHTKTRPEVIYNNRRVISGDAISSFQAELAAVQWSTIDASNDVNSNYENFLLNFDYLYNKSFPIKKTKMKVFRNLSKPWITTGIQKSIKKKEKLYKKWLNSRTSDAELNYKKYKNKFTSIMRAAKNKYYTEKFSELKDNLKKTWCLIKSVINGNKYRNDDVKEIKCGDHLITSKQAVANKFNEYFAHIGQNLAAKIPEADGNYADTITENISVKGSMFVEPTNVLEITNIVNDLKPNKSAGYDSYSPMVIKAVMPSVIQPLMEIFNQSLMTGVFPDKLKIARVTPIFKSEDKLIMSNYRPVSVLPVFSKILERLMYNRLLKYFESNSLLSSNQFGFREKHSTYMALASLVDNITKELEQRRHCVGIFIDLSKAFDTLDHRILLDKLNLYGVRGLANAWFTSYLSNRQQFVQIGNEHSKMLPINCGVPQGSILGPLLFILYINDLVHVSKLAKIIMFADDTNLFFSGEDIDKLNYDVNKELIALSLWFKLNKLSLNIKKTNFMLFRSKSKRIRTDLRISIDGVEVLEVTKAKFLGVIINNTLTWNDHITMIKSKVVKNIGIIYRMKLFVPRSVLLSLYHALVEPYLQYCNIIWAGHRTSVLRELHLCQKRLMRIMTNSSRLTHSAPLFKQLSILTVYDINNLQVGCFMYCAVNRLLPECFSSMFVPNSALHSYNTRRHNDIHQTQFRLNSTRFSIRVYGALLWNSLDVEIKSLPTLNSFKNRYKQNLIASL